MLAEVVDKSISDLIAFSSLVYPANESELHLRGVRVTRNLLDSLEIPVGITQVQRALRTAIEFAYEQEHSHKTVKNGVWAEGGLFDLVSMLKTQGIGVDWSELWADINRSQQ